MSCKTNGGSPRGTFFLSAKRQPAPSPEHVLTSGRPLDQVAQSDVVKVSIRNLFSFTELIKEHGKLLSFDLTNIIQFFSTLTLLVKRTALPYFNRNAFSNLECSVSRNPWSIFAGPVYIICKYTYCCKAFSKLMAFVGDFACQTTP